MAPHPGMALLQRIGARARSAGALPMRAAFGYLGFTEETAEVVLQPADLIAGDPAIADRLYRGEFALAGETLLIPGQNPFAVEPPSAAWRAELEGFAWLRHITAAKSEIANALARALAGDWGGTARSGPYDPEGAAIRLTSWLRNAHALGLDRPETAPPRLVATLMHEAHRLSLNAGRAETDLGRLQAAAAVALSALCISSLAGALPKATAMLGRELNRQILPDGGHVSRNPDALVALLLTLLPLRDAYPARNIAPPEELMNAIDRMVPMVKMMRHGDSGLAFFNGAEQQRADELATVLGQCNSTARALVHAPHSGFERIAHGPVAVIADAGRPGRHDPAFTGAFELSDGRHRIVVNHGHLLKGGRGRADCAVRAGLRIDEAGGQGRLALWLSHRLTAASKRPNATRQDSDKGSLVNIRHDPAWRGIAHERSFYLSADGLDLRGEDRLMAAGGAAARDITIAFPLHPALKVSRSSGRGNVLIVLPNRVGWQFSAHGADISFEDFACGEDSFSTRIVLKSRAEGESVVKWSFKRISKPLAKSLAPAQAPQLPLGE